MVAPSPFIFKMIHRTLGSLRLSEQTLDNLEMALVKINNDNSEKMSLAELRRISYDLMSQLVLSGDVEFE